jgi:TetR/AcrR family fatty acid metabolism transcriptional regulator
MKSKERPQLLSTKIIAEEALYKTEVQEIHESAEMALGTIYMYFKNKEEILDYILSHKILG